jgi:predicted PurR-regulated permease PerM
MNSGKTWLRVGLIVAGLWLTWALMDLLMLVALALLLTAALSPITTWLNGRGAPHWLSAAAVMLGLLGVLVGFGVYLAPLVVDQAAQLGEALPTLSTRLETFENQWRGWREQTPMIPRFQEVTAWLQAQTSAVFASVLGITGRFVLLLAGVVSVLFLTFFFLMEGGRLREQVLSLLPFEHRDRTRRVVQAITRQVGHYMLGRVLVMAAVGVLTGLGLWLLGIPFAALLGLISGLLDIVPFIGPFLAAVPGVAVGLSLGLEKAVWVAGLYWAVQAVEGYVLSPLIVGRTVGLHPVWIFLALLVGETFLGLVGVILSVPAAVAVQVLISEVYRPYLAERRRASEVEAALAGTPFPADAQALAQFAEGGGLDATALDAPERAWLRRAFQHLPARAYAGPGDVVIALRRAGAFEVPHEPAPPAEPTGAPGA